jgi:plastocyanin
VRHPRIPAPAWKLAAVLLAFLAVLVPGVFADVTGTVTIKGTPNSKDETFTAPATNCGEGSLRHTENWKIGPKGELADVVVWIVDAKLVPFPTTVPPPPPPKIEIRQIGCRYDPHVIAVQAGVPFTIVNADPTYHNILAKVYDGPGQPPGADVFNFGQTYQGQKDDRHFDTTGIFTFQCNVHNWMQAWVMVLKDPGFGVTGADGVFRLNTGNATLADGDYKIDAWHPRFAQTLEQIIHVKNRAARVEFQFDGSKSF